MIIVTLNVMLLNSSKKHIIIMFKNIFTYLRVIPVITTYYVIEKNVVSVSSADGVSM